MKHLYTLCMLLLVGCACDLKNTVKVTPDNPISEDSPVLCEDDKNVVYK